MLKIIGLHTMKTRNRPLLLRVGLKAVALAAGAGLALSAAQAQVWAHVDENGVTHFTNVPQAHGRLVLAGPPEPAPAVESVPVAAGAEAAARRAVASVSAKPVYQDLQPHLHQVAQAHGVDLALVKAVAVAESAFNPLAVSHKGAVGLMQVMPATAQRYAMQHLPRAEVAQRLKDPRLNAELGVRYLADLQRLFPGRLDLVLAAYNAGEGAVTRAGHQIPNYRETQHYVSRVLALYRVLTG